MKTAFLYAPQSYVDALPETRAAITNGCGAGGWKLDLVPDSILGVDIAPACNIHDWMYSSGSTLADKQEADRVFLNNMLRIVEEKSGNFATRFIRRRLALHYYAAVRDYGSQYFWEDKNPPETFRCPKEVFAS